MAKPGVWHDPDDIVDAVTEIRKSPGGTAHWLTLWDEDDEPYGELCWCTETDGENHD